MELDQELIGVIQRKCLLESGDPEQLCRLMRNHVGKILNCSGTVVQLRVRETLRYNVGFDVTPHLLRAMRLVTRMPYWRLTFPDPQRESTATVDRQHLRASNLGPHMRELASGHVVISCHKDQTTACTSTFVFVGVNSNPADYSPYFIHEITRHLHGAFFGVYSMNREPRQVLTRAEQQICNLLIEGLSNRQIAKVLKKSEATVRNQLHEIFAKMCVSTRTAAVAQLTGRGPFSLRRHSLKNGVVIDQVFYRYGSDNLR